jgi:hypothetical protein
MGGSGRGACQFGVREKALIWRAVSSAASITISQASLFSLGRHCTLNLRNLAPAIEDEVFIGKERSLAQTPARCDERPHRYDIGPTATAGPVEGVRSDKLWFQDAVGSGLVGRAVFAEMTRAIANRGRWRASMMVGQQMPQPRPAKGSVLDPARHGTDVTPGWTHSLLSTVRGLIGRGHGERGSAVESIERDALQVLTM